MAETVRIGFVGCGRIADLHEMGIRAHPHAELAALCDLNEETLADRAKEWNVEKTCTDYRRLLDDPDIDAIEFMTPHHLHRDQVIAALDAGNTWLSKNRSRST